jgi:hypothetical protein
MSDLFELLETIGEEEGLAADCQPSPKADNSLGSEPEMYKRVAEPNGKIRLVPATTAERLANCGKLRHRANPKTGERKGYYQRCGLRECSPCMTKKGQDEKDSLSLATGGIEIKRLIVKNGDILPEIKSGLYRRYPQETETVILTIDPTVQGESVNLEDLDWTNLVRTPIGKNISGKLNLGGKIASDKPDGPAKRVRYEAVIIEDPSGRDEKTKNQDIDLSWEEATFKTADFDPDLETIFFCMQDRMNEFKNQVEVKGYIATFSVYKYEWVYESEIDWKPYNDSIRKKFQRQGVYDLSKPGQMPSEWQNQQVWSQGEIDRAYRQSIGLPD